MHKMHKTWSKLLKFGQFRLFVTEKDIESNVFFVLLMNCNMNTYMHFTNLIVKKQVIINASVYIAAL
jgi:hypothetical protein